MHYVLIVDDNPGDVELTRIAFAESGLAVRLQAATSLQDARKLLDALEAGVDVSRPEMILLDLNLGDGSGHDLLAHIKQQPRLKCIPVVIATTSDSPQDRARSASLGAAAYMVKPNSFDTFVQALKDLEPFLR